ncbi:hypothetical protein BZG36_03537 [Bifiguratus adelaidae]|uniref:CCHC-type domain-containing protein n=1 Tax=Bifiguratus adelaidae TaxID=1938954 RepID=A0A261XZ82_9FUNG|nr:hypothetical protein BZG36_03537 [Bifiguratus adelaidae]
MTRYTKLERKRHVEAGTWTVKPLEPSKPEPATIPSTPSESPNKRKHQEPHKKSKKPKHAKGNVDKENSDDNKSSPSAVKRSESRRQRRIKDRQSNMVCFSCRKAGHSVKDCPESQENAGICYNCGSLEHSLKECRKQSKSGNRFEYAKCFVCNKMGHLSSQCPQNERGLYPQGGSCRFCGKVDHLAKDCNATKDDIGVDSLGTISLEQGADDDDYHIFVKEKQKVQGVTSKRSMPAKKIVTF